MPQERMDCFVAVAPRNDGVMWSGGKELNLGWDEDLHESLATPSPSLRAQRSNPCLHEKKDGLLRRGACHRARRRRDPLAPLRKRFAFVAGNDGGGASHTAVVPRACGGSNTPRPINSIIGASEYWIARRSLSSGGAMRRPGGG